MLGATLGIETLAPTHLYRLRWFWKLNIVTFNYRIKTKILWSNYNYLGTNLESRLIPGKDSV